MSYTSLLYTTNGYQSPVWMQGFSAITSTFTNTTVSFTGGSARSFTNDFVIEYPGTVPNLPGRLTLNTAIIGAGGCYPLGISAVTPVSAFAIVPVYLVSNTAGTTFGSLNPAVAPALVIGTAKTGFLPPQYDTYTQVGVVLINTSGNLIPYVENGNLNSRNIMIGTGQIILNGGAAVGPTTIPISFLPYNIVTGVFLEYAFVPNAVANLANIYPLGLTVGSPGPVMLRNAAALGTNGPIYTAVGQNTDGSCALAYTLTSTSDVLSLWLTGFSFNMPFTA